MGAANIQERSLLARVRYLFTELRYRLGVVTKMSSFCPLIFLADFETLSIIKGRSFRGSQSFSHSRKI